MTLTDFVFRGDRLSDLDCMIAYMVTGTSDSVSMGSVMSHETLYINSTYKSKKLRVKYEEPVTATFDIFKKDCNTNDITFSDKEISHIMKWLGAETSQKFAPIYDDYSYPGVWFMGVFTQISAITSGYGIIGFTVTFEADTAWGFANPRTVSVSGTTQNWTFVINCDSDKEGYIYPTETVIKMDQGSGGNFYIQHYNDSFPRDSVNIQNVRAGEILELDGEYKIINEVQMVEGTYHEGLYNDFNYNYPRLWTNYSTNKNIFIVSIPCSIEITYAPIRKVGIIV